MAASSIQPVRCAIYTRKSTEHGLELEFNSLDAQREACEAYIKSQASQGWRVLPQPYNDPAYSGGNLERPALKHLLKDIDAGKVDVVVVYKIDRLTRSLADFAKLVEAFDARSISFVAVTQQFNTTTSMGRLTLNVLLSFAQFERELSSERVRDKIAASRAKGKWTGGSVPLGYDVKDKKLVPNPAERDTVRYIFQRYLELGSFQKLVDDLDRRKIVSKRRVTTKQPNGGGVPFTYGPLAYLLKNRLYVGEIGHKNKWFDGEHEPIVDRETFDLVQARLGANAIDRTSRRTQSGALLMGKLFDDHGNRMSPSFSTKNSVRYRFYVSSALLRGRRAEAGSVARVAASEIEAVVIRAIRERLNGMMGTEDNDADLIEALVERVEVASTNIRITIRDHPNVGSQTFDVPWVTNAKKAATSLETGGADAPVPDQKMTQAVIRSHKWIEDLRDGKYQTIEDLAKAVKLHPKIVRQELRLAFLPPDVTGSIIGGDCSIQLRQIPKTISLSWARQRDQIGLK